MSASLLSLSSWLSTGSACWWHCLVSGSNLVLKVKFPRASDWCIKARTAEIRQAFLVKQQHGEQLRVPLDQL